MPKLRTEERKEWKEGKKKEKNGRKEGKKRFKNSHYQNVKTLSILNISNQSKNIFNTTEGQTSYL